MGRQTSLLTFTGRVGNLIGYNRNGKHFMRCMPETVRQTSATRQAAQRFGVASRKGRLIRSAFAQELDIRSDGSRVNRLNKTIIKGGRNNPGAIAGFRFNRYTGIDKFFCVDPVLSADGILHIPAQTLKDLKGFTALEVKVIAARISFAERKVVDTETATLILNTREPFAGAALSVDVPGKGTLIVILQVRAMKDGYPSGNRKYVAADIVAVQEPQTGKIFHQPPPPPTTMLRHIKTSFRSPNGPSTRHIIQRE
ncbi:hypothetical protein [Chitinophaga sp. XS-30]|uniref:hypothetical protein n=1 Tax=Chitinophaga sp. XS-30 TaxID=2604421 RepID=UPI0011DCD495|nr:hypothetical protein [Chitinophaga sp. XS-30]QEH39362.1 hypothetical protein FW415_00130 [Chitinophaga sp. XS-30]